MDPNLNPNEDGLAPMVDPFLIEALHNPRHRLTVLRMELDIQRFLRTSDQQQFEFQPFPTSYLRLAAHRVAQHYGLQTMVQDNTIDGLGTRIIVRRTADTIYPSISLSEIPFKESENDKPEQLKIFIRPRPNKATLGEGNEHGVQHSSFRSVEERKEEYDRARARIFNGPDQEDTFSDGKSCSILEENESYGYSIFESERGLALRDGGSTSRVAAIFRDREKDRTDPDYDRSYERYMRNFPTTNQSLNFVPMSMQKIQPPFVRYDAGFPQVGPMSRTQASLGYVPCSTPAMTPFSAMGLNQTSADAVYMQWPTPSMMYAHSYDQFRHAVFQAPFCEPLSFDYSQNY